MCYIFFSGQVLSANTLDHHVSVELIHEGFKYKIQVTKSGPNSYFLIMNGSFKEIEVHRLSDGGKYTAFILMFKNVNLFLNTMQEYCYLWMDPVSLLTCEKKLIDTE